MVKVTNERNPTDLLVYRVVEVIGGEGNVLFEEESRVCNWYFTNTEHSFVLPDNWRI